MSLTREQLFEELWSEPALKVAARHGVSSSYLARVCDALIARGARVNEADMRGNTPLHKAVNDGNVAVAEILVAAGADVSKGDDKGVTPLAIAQRKKNLAMLAILAKSGAASALIPVGPTIENTRLPPQRCTEMGRFASSRTSRVRATGAPLIAAS